MSSSISLPVKVRTLRDVNDWLDSVELRRDVGYELDEHDGSWAVGGKRLGFEWWRCGKRGCYSEIDLEGCKSRRIQLRLACGSIRYEILV